MTSFVMKLFPLLLVGAILTPGAALAGGNNNGNGCRNDRAQFRLIQEAVFLRDNGLLSQEVHPRHYAALYGTSTKKFSF